MARDATHEPANRVAASLPFVTVAIALAGLFARLMTYPVRHDEQIYLPVGVLFGQGDLYRDYGFNNLPNFPMLVRFVLTAFGSDHLLLGGRLIVFAGWAAAAGAIAVFAARSTGERWAGVLAALLLLTNPVLLGQTGMLATNNFLPMPFAVLGTVLFLTAFDRESPRSVMLLAAGFCVAVAAGFKANYIFLVPPLAAAALLVPRHVRAIDRLTHVTLPFAVGGVLGALPTLGYFVSDPDSFLAHVIRYHRGPHIAYWLQNPDLDGTKVMTLAGKLWIAASVWSGGGTILVTAVIVALAWIGRRRRADREAPPVWPILLVLALIAGGMTLSFAPTPAFPQYYTAPIPFGIILLALLYARIPSRDRTRVRPWTAAILAVPVVLGLPRLALAVPSLAHSKAWTVYRVHAAGVVLADIVRRNGGAAGPIATLAPIYPMEGGLAVYPALAAGPLVYRVGELIPQADRKYYDRRISPATIARLLDKAPPAGLLVGLEGTLDDPLIAYANQHGYRRVDTVIWSDRYGTARLYLKPSASPRGS